MNELPMENLKNKTQSFPLKDLERFQAFLGYKKSVWSHEMTLLKKAQKYLAYLSFLPWLEMIAVGNSIAMYGAHDESDIDLFIITTPKTLWFNRILITLYFQLLWQRKTANHHKWRFCLSFFVTTHGLDFSSWKLENDIYLYFWIVFLKPIINYNQTFENFLLKNTSWADFSLYQGHIDEHKKYIIKSGEKTHFLETFLSPFNTFLKKIFLPKTLHAKQKLWNPYGIIVDDSILKFHDNDRRRDIRDHLS